MAKIDKVGRIGIPQNLRERYNINGDFTDIDLIDTGNGILIKPLSNRYTIDEEQMRVLRELYIMLNETGLLDSYSNEILAKITKKSESICEKCGSNLFLNATNLLSCYKCKGE